MKIIRYSVNGAIVPGFGAIGHLFLHWWGRGRGPVGKMPHQTMVLKNALVFVLKLRRFRRGDKSKPNCFRKQPIKISLMVSIITFSLHTGSFMARNSVAVYEVKSFKTLCFSKIVILQFLFHSKVKTPNHPVKDGRIRVRRNYIRDSKFLISNCRVSVQRGQSVQEDTEPPNAFIRNLFGQPIN